MKYIYIKSPCVISIAIKVKRISTQNCFTTIGDGVRFEDKDIQYSKFSVSKESEDAYWIYMEEDNNFHCVAKYHAIEAESLDKLDLLIHLG